MSPVELEHYAAPYVQWRGLVLVNDSGPYPCKYTGEWEQEAVYRQVSEADASWSYVDAAGHFHAYDNHPATINYPTLSSGSRPSPACEMYDAEGCEGERVKFFYCTLCHEEITPATLQFQKLVHRALRISWHLVVYSTLTDVLPSPITGPVVVSVRVILDSSERFGHAVVGGLVIDSDGHKWQLDGTNTVGRRNRSYREAPTT